MICHCTIYSESGCIRNYPGLHLPYPSSKPTRPLSCMARGNRRTLASHPDIRGYTNWRHIKTACCIDNGGFNNLAISIYWEACQGFCIVKWRLILVEYLCIFFSCGQNYYPLFIIKPVFIDSLFSCLSPLVKQIISCYRGCIWVNRSAATWECLIPIWCILMEFIYR